MAPPIKPQDQRKTAYAVSLTMAERTLFQYMGGSAYLQGHLLQRAEAIAIHHDGKVPGKREVEKAVQVILNAHRNKAMHATPMKAGKPPGHANRKSMGIVTPKTRVTKKYPHAVCENTGLGGYQAWQVFSRPQGVHGSRLNLGESASTPNFAWQHAAMTIPKTKEA